MRRPAAAELHGVLLGDYNIIARGGGPREPLHVARAIGVMILKCFELHPGPGGPELRGQAHPVRDPPGREPAAARQRPGGAPRPPGPAGSAHSDGPPLPALPPAFFRSRAPPSSWWASSTTAGSAPRRCAARAPATRWGSATTTASGASRWCTRGSSPP